MKKLSFLLIISIILATTTAFATPRVEFSENASTNAVGGSFKILNDTDGDVQIYTGSGFVELNKGASTSVTCEVGRKIHSANKGKKGSLLFEVDESMCGKTVKLSNYL